ncbi:hypothetical protein E3N88_45306 [Mikania micrantha]|uniref:Integrase catalytic domain-containing protein n=1 Tax=Mikania micrantha TaxID=192012 RepID=A0A5N6L9S9_9ASTR|nr:hypothetical protein E3N88_45306 [Mikania micrantha]
MIPLLSYQHLLHHIDGSKTAPASFIQSNEKAIDKQPLYLQWVQEEQQAIIILKASLTEEALSVTVGLSTARDIWMLLNKPFSNTSIERVQNLRDNLHFFEALSIFVPFVQTQFSSKIKTFQSDGGTEFTNNRVRKLFEQNGTFHRMSCPYTPQQNGRVERKHRHIVETGLAMMFHAKLPTQYCVDAFSSATFIINRLPTTILDGKSPFELLFHVKPNYSNFRTFGCRVFPYLRDYSTNKLSSRSIPCIFIGYCSKYKGYRCLDPCTSRVYVTRHARFDESHFSLDQTTMATPINNLEVTIFLEAASDNLPTISPNDNLSNTIFTSVPQMNSQNQNTHTTVPFPPSQPTPLDSQNSPRSNTPVPTNPHQIPSQSTLQNTPRPINFAPEPTPTLISQLNPSVSSPETSDSMQPSSSSTTSSTISSPTSPSSPEFPSYDSSQLADLLVLKHMTCIAPYVKEHMDILRSTNRGKDEMWYVMKHNKEFSSWMKTKVIATNVDQTVKRLGQGPYFKVRSYQGYYINGYTFYTKDQDEKSTMQNSRVIIIVSTTEFDTMDHSKMLRIAKESYYGVIQEIWELNYHSFVIRVYRCKWVNNRTCVKVDKCGFILVDLASHGYVSEPFVLAKQVTQVFLVNDPSKPKYHIILHGKRRIIGVDHVIYEEEYNQFDELPPF